MNCISMTGTTVPWILSSIYLKRRTDCEIDFGKDYYFTNADGKKIELVEIESSRPREIVGSVPQQLGLFGKFGTRKKYLCITPRKIRGKASKTKNKRSEQLP